MMSNNYLFIFLFLPICLIGQSLELKEKALRERPPAKLDYSNIQLYQKENHSFEPYLTEARWHQSSLKSYQPSSSSPFYGGLKIWHQDSLKQNSIFTGKLPIDRPESSDQKDAAVQKIKSLRFISTEMNLIEVAYSQEGGRHHLRMQQTYEGIPFYGAYLSLHFTEREIYFLNNETIEWEGNLDTDPAFDLSQAIQIAYQNLNLSKQGFLPPALLEEDRGSLKYVLGRQGNWTLSYELVIHPRLDKTFHVFIHALTGEVLDYYESLCKIHAHPPQNGPVQASAMDLSGINRTIHLYEQNNIYYLIDASRSMFDASNSTIPSDPIGAIVTLDANNTAPQQQNFTAEIINQSNNNWNGNPKAVSAHYNAGRAYEYFLQTFNRNSIDGQGGTMISLINVADEGGGGLDNAFWNGKAMFYGNGNQAFTPLAEALDVAGHEMSHGVIQNTANLEYRDEPGAINESYADIFGVMIDRDDWKLAEDIVIRQAFPSGAMRDMQNPNQGGNSLGDPGWQPAHYDERYTGSQNNGGVHINSGIVNRAFYLVANQIGKDKAEQIYYHTLTNYLNRRSDFLDLRASLEQSAGDLYSNPEVQAIEQAFDQVGIIPEGGGSGGGNGSNDGFPILTQNPGQDIILISQDFPAEMNLYNNAGDLTVSSIIPETSLSRPSATDNGSAIVYVDQNRTISYITINWQQGTYSNVQTLDLRDNNGQLIRWANVAISKNGRLLALVPNEQIPLIILFDLATSESKAFELYNPTYSQTQTNTNAVVSADALEFDHAGETLIYDAFNRLDGTGGFNEEYWDINIIDVWDNGTEQFTEGTIIPLFAALPENVSIGNPTYSKNATGVLAFDYIEEGFFSNTYALLAMDLSRSQTATVYVNDRLSFPTYSNRDDAILFDATDQFGQEVVGHIAMQDNRIEPSENPFIFQSGYWAVWFANGNRPLVNGVRVHSQADFVLAPNPAENWLEIQGVPLEDAERIQIFSLDGRTVLNWHLDRSTNRLDVNQLQPGIYWMLYSGQKGVQQSSFIKQ